MRDKQNTQVVKQFVIMGVSGCGKSSVGRMLAARLGGLFIEADDFHPPANLAKMAASNPLTDEDRWPWLKILNNTLKSHAQNGRTVFLACSALRQIHRERLAADLPQLRFIYLQGSKKLLLERMQRRRDHFMPADLLDSQFATLEEPTDAIVVSVADPLPTVVERILEQITREDGIHEKRPP